MINLKRAALEARFCRATLQAWYKLIRAVYSHRRMSVSHTFNCWQTVHRRYQNARTIQRTVQKRLQTASWQGWHLYAQICGRMSSNVQIQNHSEQSHICQLALCSTLFHPYQRKRAAWGRWVHVFYKARSTMQAGLFRMEHDFRLAQQLNYVHQAAENHCRLLANVCTPSSLEKTSNRLAITVAGTKSWAALCSYHTATYICQRSILRLPGDELGCFGIFIMLGPSVQLHGVF